MDRLGLRFHHLGLAAREPAAACRVLKGLGYRCGEEIFDPEQNVRLVMCDHDSMPSVEVIAPGSDGKTPVDRLVAKHGGGIVYHLCYTTQDLSGTLAAMEKEGLHATCVAPPTPAILFGGERVSFYLLDGLGLIEIIEAA
jgi:methylmalonyl-CoA/ethylmalonyl-CoA epimerase